MQLCNSGNRPIRKPGNIQIRHYPSRSDQKMADKKESTAAEQRTVSMQVRYENMETQFASQFIVNSTREEIIVNFSPGAIADPQTNQQMLPINSRIAMTPNGAARLVQTLTNVLKNLQAAAQPKTTEEQTDSSLN
jgi:hypothetical protein